MAKLRTLILCLLACLPAAACATVSVYDEPLTAEVSLTQDQSELHAAAEAFNKSARDKGLASGEASLASIAGMLSGKQSDANAYWRRIGADKAVPATVITKVRADMNTSAKGLNDLDDMARSLIKKGDPARLDVAAFEGALIHARQARDSISDALVQVNKRPGAEYQITAELAPLDAALASARATADKLAQARAEGASQTTGS
ncbi:MAG: hypothetical protein ABMA14_02385 [Hyphomonadaceae bacterium]